MAGAKQALDPAQCRRKHFSYCNQPGQYTPTMRGHQKQNSQDFNFDVGKLLLASAEYVGHLYCYICYTSHDPTLMPRCGLCVPTRCTMCPVVLLQGAHSLSSLHSRLSSSPHGGTDPFSFVAMVHDHSPKLVELIVPGLANVR